NPVDSPLVAQGPGERESHPSAEEAGQAPEPAHRDGEEPLGNGSSITAHAASESHATAPAETPVEMLPPISGGAPDPEDEGGESADHGTHMPPPEASTSTGTLEADLPVTHPGGEARARGESRGGSGSAVSETASAGGHLPGPDDWEPEGAEATAGPEPGSAIEEAALAEAVSAEAIAQHQAE